jgi:cell division protein FtsB
MDDRGPLDLERQIEDLEKMYDLLKKDNLYLAKEIDRLNEYVQEMEMINVGKK